MIASYYCNLCKQVHTKGQILYDHRNHAQRKEQMKPLSTYDIDELEI